MEPIFSVYSKHETSHVNGLRGIMAHCQTVKKAKNIQKTIGVLLAEINAIRLTPMDVMKNNGIRSLLSYSWQEKHGKG